MAALVTAAQATLIPSLLPDAAGLQRSLDTALAVFFWALALALPVAALFVPLAILLHRRHSIGKRIAALLGGASGGLPFALLAVGALATGVFGAPDYRVVSALLTLIPYSIAGIISGASAALFFWRFGLKA